MQPYYSDDRVTLHHGDCLDVMRDLPNASVDAIVTDPPYGLGFMGKEWDALPPGLPWAQECLRVLKPGGYLLAFGGTRTWHRLAVAVEDAGFEIRDSIAWIHGQGFPKGQANLKPAHEPVVVARRSPEAPGAGLLQIDAARIGMNDANAAPGRWPANVILDESRAEELGRQSGVKRNGGQKVKADREPSEIGLGVRMHTERPTNFAGDSGTASRFFYVAKADVYERVRVDGTAHPTVKPLNLMRWLVRLVTPSGGTALDPFAGSGTTVEACLLEGFRCVAIEREVDYLPLIEQRIHRRRDPVAAVKGAGGELGLFDLLEGGAE